MSAGRLSRRQSTRNLNRGKPVPSLLPSRSLTSYIRTCARARARARTARTHAHTHTHTHKNTHARTPTHTHTHTHTTPQALPPAASHLLLRRLKHRASHESRRHGRAVHGQWSLLPSALARSPRPRSFSCNALSPCEAAVETAPSCLHRLSRLRTAAHLVAGDIVPGTGRQREPGSSACAARGYRDTRAPASQCKAAVETAPLRLCPRVPSQSLLREGSLQKSGRWRGACTAWRARDRRD